MAYNNSIVKIYRLSSKDITLIIRNDEGITVNLTGYSGTFKVYIDEPQSRNNPIISLVPTITTPLSGLITIPISSTHAQNIGGIYTYKVELTDGTDTVINYGVFEIKDNYTEEIKDIIRSLQINFKTDIIVNALDYANKEILKNAFITEKVEIKNGKEEHKIDNFVMSKQFNSLVDKNDIKIYQYMTQTPYTVEDLFDEVSSINFSHPIGKTIINLSSQYPESGYVLMIEYYRGSKSWIDLSVYIKRLKELYFMLYLFENLDIYQLQRGITTKSLNGVDISYNKDAIEKLKKDIRNQIFKNILKTRPIQIKSVNINKGY